MHKNFFDKKPQFELKPILNTFLAGRVWYIFRNFELNISNTQPELEKAASYKIKKRAQISGEAVPCHSYTDKIFYLGQKYICCSCMLTAPHSNASKCPTKKYFIFIPPFRSQRLLRTVRTNFWQCLNEMFREWRIRKKIR